MSRVHREGFYEQFSRCLRMPIRSAPICVFVSRPWSSTKSITIYTLSRFLGRVLNITKNSSRSHSQGRLYYHRTQQDSFSSLLPSFLSSLSWKLYFVDARVIWSCSNYSSPVWNLGARERSSVDLYWSIVFEVLWSWISLMVLPSYWYISALHR